MYMETGDLGPCAEEVLRLYAGEENAIRPEEVPTTWERARERIQIRLVNKEWNQKMLEHVPYREYLDLAMIFCVQVSQGEEASAAFTVTREMTKRWKVGTEELWEAAWKNLENEEFSIESMTSVLESILGRDVFEEERSLQNEETTYIMSNQARNYGARAVLNPKLLQGLADRERDSFYLLPSSVHEWILCKDDGKTDVYLMKSMVCEINKDSCIINPEDCLSDSIYRYDWEQKKIGIVA